VSSYYFSITFSATSVGFSTCVVITGSQISASWYKSEVISLTSSFAEFRAPISYLVTNQNGDEVGAILSDGVAVVLSDVGNIQDSYYICINFTSTYVDIADFETYTVYDFGTPVLNNTQVRPNGFTVVLSENTLCASIKQTSSEEIYFAIVRVENYQDSVPVFDFPTLVQFYILASVFLLSSIYGLTVLTIILVQVARGAQEFKLQLFVLLFCLFLFNISNGF
jgi:hypothetical protein